jgi:putative ABC transport system permease protein
MNLLESSLMAAKTLSANKLRTLLTMLGIIIGNASVILVVAIGEGAQHFTRKQLETMGPYQISVYASDRSGGILSTEIASLTLADAEAISAQASAVARVAPQIQGSLKANYQSRTINATISATTPGILYVRNLKVDRGRFFTSLEQQESAPTIVLGSTIASKLFDRQNPLGQSIQLNNSVFRVIGTLTSKGASFGINYDENVYLPITTGADRLFSRRSPYGLSLDFLELSAQNQESIRAAAFQATNILVRRHGKRDFSLSANKSFQDSMDKITTGLSVVLAGVASISLLVGGIGIMNIMLVSVTERTKEIGLRKAIGATQSAILTQFLIEALILSIGGGGIGILIGSGGAMAISLLTQLQIGIPLGAIVLATTVSGGIGLIFGVAPARRAAQLDPIVALRG